MCRDFVRENANEWSEKKEIKKQRQDEEERKTERLEKFRREKEKVQKRLVDEKIS